MEQVQTGCRLTRPTPATDGLSARKGNEMNATKYLTTCCKCGRKTSRVYARQNGGQCKSCKHPEQARVIADRRAEREHSLLIDSGYQAYARERGDYDLPDYA
jgi:hypothetical protein